MRRLAGLLLVLGGLAALVLAATPAGAIETVEFGVAPAASSGGARAHLRADVRPGRPTDDALRVWNKTGAPVAVRLSVSGASLDAAGHVSLGGTGGAFSWVRLSETEVVLPPHGERVVAFSVTAPRHLPKGEQTVAFVAESAAAEDSGVAVVQRVAVMGYFGAPAGSTLRAALGWAAWAAAGLFALTLVYALSPVRRGRRKVSRLATLRFTPATATAQSS